MYVLNIIRNYILYIGFTYMYIFHIIFRMVLSTWLHTTLLYEGLHNVFALPNLQTPSFKFSQVIFASFQKNCFHVFSKQTSVTTTLQSYTAHIWPWINLKFWWNIKTMSTTFFQNFSSFNFIKWEILLLPWSHLKLRPEYKMTYNSLLATSNSLRFWETH
jgi:hypothetical protein